MPGLCCWRREYQLDCVCIQEEVVAQLRENSENIMEEMERMKVSGVTATGSISIIYLRQQQLRYKKCGYQFDQHNPRSSSYSERSSTNTLRLVVVQSISLLLCNQLCTDV